MNTVGMIYLLFFYLSMGLLITAMINCFRYLEVLIKKPQHRIRTGRWFAQVIQSSFLYAVLVGMICTLMKHGVLHYLDEIDILVYGIEFAIVAATMLVVPYFALTRRQPTSWIENLTVFTSVFLSGYIMMTFFSQMINGA